MRRGSEPIQNGTAGVRPGFCPGCGRYAGTGDACPYCDAELPDRFPGLGRLRGLAVVLALIGLVVLYVAALRHEIPRVTANRLVPRMTFGLVEIRGEVARRPFVRDEPESSMVSLSVDDGTGKIRVMAYDALAEALIRQARVPRQGDSIVATGTLRVSADGEAVLNLRSAEALQISDVAVPRPAKTASARQEKARR